MPTRARRGKHAEETPAASLAKKEAELQNLWSLMPQDLRSQVLGMLGGVPLAPPSPSGDNGDVHEEMTRG
jgi:hypothetical protein